MEGGDVPRRVIFSFLEDIMKLWRERYSPTIEQTAIAFSLNNEFSMILKERMVSNK